MRELLPGKEDELDVALAILPANMDASLEVDERQVPAAIMAHLAELIVEEVKKGKPN